MELFHIIDDAQAVIKKCGIFYQVKVYRRSTEIFVQHGSGFVKLSSRGNTSVPNICWLDLNAKGVIIEEPGTFRAGAPTWQPND